MASSNTNTLDWEDSRAEFFQESFYPSESLKSNTSTDVTSRGVRIPPGGVASSFRDASVGTLESRSSRVSVNRTASTTQIDEVSPTGGAGNAEPSIAEEPALSVCAPSSMAGTSSRATKPRMRAAVQGLEEEEESEGEIEVVDFTDGKSFFDFQNFF